jgi:hypothetical protein
VAKPEYIARTWRVRTWIRALSVGQSLGWLALIWSPGFRRDESIWTIVAFVAFVVVPPYLALSPVIKLQPNGALTLRGWTSQRRLNADQIIRLTMTEFGLEIIRDDCTRFTSVIFQATHSFGRPRVLEFVDAIRRGPGGAESFDPLKLFRENGLEIYSRDDPGA